MARPTMNGNKYFPVDVDIFSDKKVKVVIGKFGTDGFVLYHYLLCEIYREGYYIVVDDDFNYVIANDLNMSDDKIGQIINFLLGRSLFDDKLFKSDKVLTSHGIQSRYQEMVKQRALKNSISVDERFWLLSESETQDFIKVTNFADFSKKNSSYSENNGSKSGNYDTKEKKGNKKKINEIIAAFSAYTSNDALLTALTSFYEMRKSINKPLDLKNAELLLKKLSDMTCNDIEKIQVLETSVFCKYPDIYPPKGKDKKTGCHNYTQRNDVDYKKIEREALARNIQSYYATHPDEREEDMIDGTV